MHNVKYLSGTVLRGKTRCRRKGGPYMNNREFALLRSLLDGVWHDNPPIKGVGPATVNQCHEHGWIDTKRFIVSRRHGVETFFTPIRLTKRGRLVYHNELYRLHGVLEPSFREHLLRHLRRLVGTGVVRSLQRGTALLHVWRRATPFNQWVENHRGKQLWHSREHGTPLDIPTYFRRVWRSKVRIGGGAGDPATSDTGMPEESTYRLKKEFC
ncbi:MAG: hypothetical protein IT406_02980 [Candidatus Yanofskybacteria bacterium]|nr:hypothetical protein [Candidatus Yanofskybacteria bacterium]